MNRSYIFQWLPIIISIFALVVSIKGCTQQSETINQAGVSNSLSRIMTENSNQELEIARKKLSFDIINTLYTDFYQFSEYNSLIIRKLQNKENVENPFNLALYLSGFEDLYQQCKTGLISKENILIHFQHLIRPTCNNYQVIEVLGERGNGLKILCHKFYPDSKLALLAEKLELDSCK